MSKSKSELRANLIYGLIVLVPLGVVALVAFQVVGVLQAVVEPVMETLGLESLWGLLLALLISVASLLLLCIGLGAAVRTRVGAMSFEKVEDTVLRQVPGYKLIANALRGFASEQMSYPTALVRLFGAGTGVFAFVMEETEGGDFVVFVPSTPAMTLGALHIVSADRVTMLDTPVGDFTACVGEFGVGASRVVGGGRV
jgi:uncharacterized membrane protein